jgi:predicted porin
MDSNDGAGNSENTYGVRAAYSLDALSVSAEYQTRKDFNDVVGVQAVYSLGANQFALSYEMVSDDTAAEDDYDIVTLQALHNISDHMYVYVEGYLQSNDNASIDEFFASGNSSVAGDERTIAAVGAVYYF